VPIDPDDWRLAVAHEYLQGRSLRWLAYAPPRQSWNHDHCDFCGEKFMVEGTAGTLHAGYTTEDAYYWICPVCFDDFRELFGWTVTRALDHDYG